MPWIFVTFHSILSVVGCVLNAMLCHVAAWKSPTVIKTYSIITVNVAITNLAICVVNFVLQMRVKMILFIIYLPSFLQMILLFFDFTDPSTLLKIQQYLVPQYDLRGQMIFGIADSTSFNAMFSIIHVAVMSTPIVLCIVVLRKKILKKMEFKGVDLNSNTRNLQLQLLRALTFQAIIPCFYLIGVISYFVCRLEIYRDPFFEYLIFSAFLFVPVLSPISAFIFVTPYRKWILGIFHLRSYKVESEKLETTTREETRDARRPTASIGVQK